MTWIEEETQAIREVTARLSGKPYVGQKLRMKTNELTSLDRRWEVVELRSRGWFLVATEPSIVTGWRIVAESELKDFYEPVYG